MNEQSRNGGAQMMRTFKVRKVELQFGSDEDIYLNIYTTEEVPIQFPPLKSESGHFAVSLMFWDKELLALLEMLKKDVCWDHIGEAAKNFAVVDA